ncbi:unnamed protein product [Gongylonema pulchrum]|uniref:Uncharacterized protein n=1 Tax=Gongylonema pulchrum TaxID=637853 RepID=A0A183E5N1_9BILA|nr:unnamed protein product [Gongylonema pulchrum]
MAMNIHDRNQYHRFHISKLHILKINYCQKSNAGTFFHSSVFVKCKGALK